MSDFPNQYQLSQKENIFLAKKLFIETIYHTSKFESCPITLPDTKTIVEGISVGGYKMDDVQIILNLKNGFRFVIEHISSPLDLALICTINQYVAYEESLEWGILRSGAVTIHGVAYTPPIPVKESIINTIKYLEEQSESYTEYALELFLYLCKSQCFWDGNKRTALLAANKMLIEHGNGILFIPETQLNTFNRLLSAYYNEGSDIAIKEIKLFLYRHCIHGISF